MNLVELRGIERREYEAKDGSGKKSFVGLHVCWQDWDGKDDKEMTGEKCESFSCPREVDVSTLKIGELYEVQYAVFKRKDGMGARVCGLTPVG